MPICVFGRPFNVNKFRNGIDLLGEKDGVNRIFTIPDNAVPHTICVYINGQRLKLDEDYETSGGATYHNTVTMLDPEYAPQSTDIFVADYQMI